MAELRRVGGALESHRRVAGRRMLLPAEAELCQTLGLTEAEYFYFLDLTESQIGKRAKGYEHIPDIQNGQAFALFLTTFLPTRTFHLHVLPAHVPPPILPKSQFQTQISLLEGNVAPKLAYLKAKLPLTLILTLILCFGFSIYGRF